MLCIVGTVVTDECGCALLLKPVAKFKQHPRCPDSQSPLQLSPAYLSDPPPTLLLSLPPTLPHYTDLSTPQRGQTSPFLSLRTHFLLYAECPFLPSRLEFR